MGRKHKTKQQIGQGAKIRNQKAGWLIRQEKWVEWHLGRVWG